MNIMDELREATRVDHEAIERSLGLTAADVSLSRYVRTLERFYGYYQPVEARLHDISGVKDVIDDLDLRRKVPLLKRDLRHWGSNDQTLPQCAGLPPLENELDAIGCLYVLEGATLGGRILTRHFQTRFGISDNAGGSFFVGYGERTGAMWKAFGRSVVAIALTRDQTEQIVRCAGCTFRTLQQWCAEDFQ